MSTRTTTAVTIVRAGEKINQIPAKAVAYVNHRIQPRPGAGRADTAVRDAVLAYDRRVIGDPRVRVELIENTLWTPPSPVSSTTSRTFCLIRQAIHDVHDGAALSAPFIMTGNTDTRWYWDVADDLYRHTPIVLGALPLPTIQFCACPLRQKTLDLSEVFHMTVCGCSVSLLLYTLCLAFLVPMQHHTHSLTLL